MKKIKIEKKCWSKWMATLSAKKRINKYVKN